MSRYYKRAVRSGAMAVLSLMVLGLILGTIAVLSTFTTPARVSRFVIEEHVSLIGGLTADQFDTAFRAAHPGRYPYASWDGAIDGLPDVLVRVNPNYRHVPLEPEDTAWQAEVERTPWV